MKASLTKEKCQTNLKPTPKKIALHFEEPNQFQNEKNSQPSTQLFSVDVGKSNAIQYKLSYMYFSLYSPHNSLHFTPLDENQKKLTPKTFKLVLLYNKKDECIR